MNLPKFTLNKTVVCLLKIPFEKRFGINKKLNNAFLFKSVQCILAF